MNADKFHVFTHFNCKANKNSDNMVIIITHASMQLWFIDFPINIPLQLRDENSVCALLFTHLFFSLEFSIVSEIYFGSFIHLQPIHL